AEAGFNLVLVMVITVYMLLDAPRISRRFASLLPASSGVDQLFVRMERSLLRYTIGQTLASVVMGVSAAVGLWVMGATGIWEMGGRYAVLFGAIVAVTEFAPSIGPAIGSIPPIATALFDGPGPTIAVIIFFLLLHQIEGHIVVPKLMGAAIAVHPLLVIFGILAGAQLMGIGGILLALPLLAVGREVVVFIRERVALGSWSDPAPVSVFAGAATAPLPAGPSVAESEALAEQSGEARRGALTARIRGWVGRRARRTSSDEPLDQGADA
ncbi:MAG: family transporter, partial [Thermoleophilia bacterium]|nr:family transporter [Thermoleophilia bacterium]